jgi:hypothetical protein
VGKGFDTSRLRLSRETIRELTSGELGDVAAGVTTTLCMWPATHTVRVDQCYIPKTDVGC